jgi:hypothetical protein
MVEKKECKNKGWSGIGNVKGEKYVSNKNDVKWKYYNKKLKKEGIIKERIITKKQKRQTKQQKIIREEKKWWG